MKKILLNTFWFVLAAALMFFAFRDVSLTELQSHLSNIHYGWLSAGLALSLYCHWLRGYRWKMLIEADGAKITTVKAFGAVMVGYMVNYALPRVGELTRCTMLLKSDRIPLTTSVGTVFTERVVDVLTLGLLAGTVFLTEFDVLAGYILSQNENRSFSGLIFIALGGMVLMLLLAFIFRKAILKNPLVAKVFEVIKTFIGAMLSVFRLKNPILFIVVSLAIWVGYITVNYLIMKALAGTSELNYYTAVIITAMGGIAMVVPAPGGTGPFHFAVTETFRIYNLNVELGRALALVIHTPQMVLNVMIGGIAFFALTASEEKNVDASVIRPVVSERERP